MIGAYYKLISLPEEIKTINNIKSKVRLDCISFFNDVKCHYEGLRNFINSKGQMYFYRTPSKEFVNSLNRPSEWSLTGNGLNLSSIYIDDIDFENIGYGYPNANRYLVNGSFNPLYEFRNDGYLFIIDKNYKQIELLVIPGGRNLISSYYQKMIDGGFEDQLTYYRKEAKVFYQYEGMVL